MQQGQAIKHLDDIHIRTELKPGDMGVVIYLHGKLYSMEYQYGVVFEAYVAEGLLNSTGNTIPPTAVCGYAKIRGERMGFLCC